MRVELDPGNDAAAPPDKHLANCLVEAAAAVLVVTNTHERMLRGLRKPEVLHVVRATPPVYSTFLGTGVGDRQLQQLRIVKLRLSNNDGTAKKR